MEKQWDVLLTVADAANLLNVSRATVYREIREKRLGAVQIRRVWRIRYSEVERYLQRHDTLARGEHLARGQSLARTPDV